MRKTVVNTIKEVGNAILEILSHRTADGDGLLP